MCGCLFLFKKNESIISCNYSILVNSYIPILFPSYWPSVYFHEFLASFIFLVSILVITKIIFFGFGNNMGTIYRCPRCQSEDVDDLGDRIYCSKCRLEFSKEFLGIIEDEDILTEVEMKGFLKGFEEDFEDPEKRRRFYESLDDDEYED